MLRALALAVLFLLPLALTGIPTAEAVGTTAVAGCSRIAHYVTSSPTTGSFFRVSTDAGPAASATCAATSATDIEPVCSTFHVKYVRQGGAAAPSNPNRWQVLFVDESLSPSGFTPGTTNDHGTTGTQNWDYAAATGTTLTVDDSTNVHSTSDGRITFGGDPNGRVLTFCPDHGATFRLVLRMCQLVIDQPQQNCGTASTNYDVNGDENPTCACSGTDAGITFSADGNPGDVVVQWNPELRDPLTVDVVDKEQGYLAYEPVNVTIDARYLNGTLRSGGASNITLHFEAPDHTWPVDGTNPTEMKFSDGTGMGRYYYTFTPTQTGTYQLTARTISALNERQISKPFSLDILSVGARQPTRDDLNVTNSLANTTLAELKGLLANLNNYQATERNASRAAVIDADATLTNNAVAYLATRMNTSEANVIAAVAALVNNANAYLATRGNTSESAIIAATATLVNNLGNYLALLQNSTTAPLMRSVHGENINAYLAALANSTTAPLARSVHLENANAYLSGRQNATTDPLAKEATLTYFGTGIFSVANLTLTADEFRAWNVGEFRPTHLTLNGTAREASLVYYGGGIFGVVNLTLTAAEFRDWNVGEFRPTRVTVNATLPTATFVAWRDGEWRHAWATINGTDGNVTSANNTASGALTQAYFNQWRDGEFRPSAAVGNQTEANLTLLWGEQRLHWSVSNATRTELAVGDANLEILLGRALDLIRADGNLTRSYLPAAQAHAAWGRFDAWWEGKGPRTSDLALVLLIGLSLLLWGIWARNARRLQRAQFILAGLVTLGAYGYASGLAALLA